MTSDQFNLPEPEPLNTVCPHTLEVNWQEGEQQTFNLATYEFSVLPVSRLDIALTNIQLVYRDGTTQQVNIHGKFIQHEDGIFRMGELLLPRPYVKFNISGTYDYTNDQLVLWSDNDRLRVAITSATVVFGDTRWIVEWVRAILIDSKP